ncbi:hypothetical protein MMC13_007936 [Lambiella insularis]|nr:hypothetical protein [Lambiella insularis]
MPAKVMRQQSTVNGNNGTAEVYNPPYRTTDTARLGESSFGEGRARKRLQKSPSFKSTPVRRQEEFPQNTVPEPRSNIVHRRQSIRDQKAPLGARPLHRSPSKQTPNASLPIPYQSTSSNVKQPPPSRQTSTATAIPFNFGTDLLDQKQEGNAGTEEYQFLPVLNFDDSHTRPASGGENAGSVRAAGSKLNGLSGGTTNDAFETNKAPNDGAAKLAVLASAEGRIVRNVSFIQRKDSTAHPNAQPTFSTAKLEAEVPTDALLPAKGRRQSYFPVSASTPSLTRTPKNYVNPGLIPNPLSFYPFLKEGASTKSAQNNTIGNPIPSAKHRVPAFTQDRFLAIEEQYAKSLSRSVKAKSLYAPDTFARDYLATTSTTPDNVRGTFINGAPSPHRSNDGGATTPSLGKRLSVMPGHATGLGARTISPTDVRRLKRLSMMPNPPPLPQTPPTSLSEPKPLSTQLTAGSPSLIPRKSITPSSNRTTPDHNRKSYCSVISNSSNTSHNSVRPLTNSLRVQASSSLSRLPTLKSRTENPTTGSEEEVPPVPAIPKAYESPKNELDIPFFSSRKSSIAFDAGSQHSSSTVNHAAMPPLAKETPTLIHNSRDRHGTMVETGSRTDEQSSRGANNNIRNLQPLRLPPINLLPLSTPTTEKIAALHDRALGDHTGAMTPPPKSGRMKTPSTPMTASKASFFSRHRHKDDSVPLPPQPRSSSSHFTLRDNSSPFRAPSSSSSSAQAMSDNWVRVKAVSPFVSSSLPKTNGDFKSLVHKALTEHDIGSFASEPKPSRLTGPREPNMIQLTKNKTRSQPASPVNNESLGDAIRRKLSLTRKRSLSKAETNATRDSDYPPRPPKHDIMPPPRLPASATWNGPSRLDPSPTQKPQYLHFRRKPSNSEAIPKLDHARIDAHMDGMPEKNLANASDHARAKVSLISDGANSLRGARSLSINSIDLTSSICGIDSKLDRDDLFAEEEMRKLALKRKDTETAAQELDELRRRAIPKERVSPTQALRTAKLNIFERGEIVDFKEIYFCGTQTAKKFTGDLEAEMANFGYDDERGDYNIVNGDHLSYRYEIVDILGKGSFGQVVRCVDHKTGALVAIKIIRNKKRFHQQALVEVNILQKLREWDPQSKFSMVNFTQSFYFRGHLCISTELLGMNLYEFIKIHDFKGFSIKLIRRFTKQLLNSLVLLKSHKVIHCDLKPENILLAHPAHSEIKVIDFGSSCLENEKVYTYIQSRFYRSPEVILGMTYGMPIDMWSLGCILAELLTGYPIFPGENEQEQLACIMEVFGPPDKHLIEKSTRKKLFFDSLGKPRLTVSSKGKRRRPSSKTLQQALKCDDDGFLDFIARCLRWDPDRRMKPDEAILHDFVTGTKPPASRNLRSLPSSAININSSPIKRYNSVHTPGTTIRPLPEPPATSLKNGIVVRNMERQNTGSPSKSTASKRHSTMTGVQAGAGVNGNAKRIANSAALSSMSSSALPRLGGPRLAGGKADMAASAAVVATSVTAVSDPSQLLSGGS